MKAQSVAPNVVGPVCVAVVALLSVAIYLLLYSPGIAREVAAGAFGEAGAQVSWLRLHIALYVGAYFALIAGLLMVILDRRAGTASRVLWTEITIAAAGALAVLGTYAGHEFAKAVWGHVPTLSDPKLAVATAIAWTLLLAGSAIAIWARARLEPHRRQTVLAIVVVAALALCAGSLLLGVFTRSLHPAPVSPWWP